MPKPTLVKGNSGIEVLKLQDLLVKFGFMTTAQLATGPGIFGPRTSASLINMQAALGLPTTGTYDDSTRTAVIARYYTEQPPPIVPPPPRPASDEQPVEERQMFNGRAVYQRYVAKLARGDVQYHVIKVDLTNAQVLVTPQPIGRLVCAGLPEKVRHGYCHQRRRLVLDTGPRSEAHPNHR